MDLNQLHFANPLWLWGLLAIPFLWMAYFQFYRSQQPIHHLEKFIDSHLLPYLLKGPSGKKHSIWKSLLLWSCVWACLTLALAGPRWDFREMETFSRDQSLVILLDLSKSMNAADAKPSRLVRAKQKIEDLINISKGLKIGLIAFAADPHMITPITEDQETIRHLLPSLDTDIIHVQGSRLSSALSMASTMFEAESGHNNAILIISDGGFEDASAIKTAKKLADKGVAIYTMGVGTSEGVPLQDHQGNIVKKNGTPILLRLEKEKLNEISKIGHGRYLTADYSDQSEALLLSDLEKRGDIQMNLSKKNRFWNERFYLILLPILPFFLCWFRRGSLIAVSLLLFTHPFELQADLQEYFINSEERGRQFLDNEEYDSAVDSFQDPYRKGVACYKSGNFAEAEKLFRQSTRPEVASNAAYNMGNALAQQQKIKEAIAAYEEVLKEWPDHTKAKENLELLKKIQENQKQDSPESDKSNDKKDKKPKDKSKSENKDKDNREDQDESNDNDQQQDRKDQQNDKTPNEQQKGQNKDNSSKDEPDSKPSPTEKNQEPNEPNETDSEENQEEQGEEDQDEKENESSDGPGEPENQEDKPADPEGSQGEREEQSEEDADGKPSKSEEDLDADLWLDQITNEPKVFLKNKFYLESKRNGTTEGIDPW